MRCPSPSCAAPSHSATALPPAPPPPPPYPPPLGPTADEVGRPAHRGPPLFPNLLYRVKEEEGKTSLQFRSNPLVSPICKLALPPLSKQPRRYALPPFRNNYK